MNKELIVLFILTIIITILVLYVVYLEFNKINENDKYINGLLKRIERMSIEQLELYGYINSLKRINDIQEHLLQTDKNK